MDLRTWIANDHASLQRRFDSSIAARLPSERWKDRPDGGGATIAWLMLHGAHHEDLALTTAIRNHEPLIHAHRSRLGLDGFEPSAGLEERESPELVEALDADALDLYVRAVRAATAAWIDTMSSMALDTVPETSSRLERKAGITREALGWLHALWDHKPVWWFVQWECIGHAHAHLGEMIGVRNRLAISGG